MQYTFTKPANSTNVIITCDDTNDRYNNYGVGRGAAAIPSGENDFAIQLNTGKTIPFALANTSFTSQTDAIDTLNSASYLGFSSPGGGGGGNVADGTTDNSLLVWSSGASSWVESLLFKLYTIAPGIFGFISIVGNYVGLIGRAGNSTIISSLNGSTGENSSISAEGGHAKIMANDGVSKSLNFDMTATDPLIATQTGRQSSQMSYYTEFKFDLKNGGSLPVNQTLISNNDVTRNLIITSIVSGVSASAGSPTYNATYEIALDSGESLSGVLSAVEKIANPSVQTAILVGGAGTLVQFNALSNDTTATQIEVCVVCVGYYLPK